MKRDDALFNWLQIQVVADARPDDQSAQETAAFFLQMLQEDHALSELAYRQEGGWYVLTAKEEAATFERKYPAETVEFLLVAIENEPKYNS
ncbi:hypothetical protein BAG01nite_22350 [Brevibacillus agri]|uniref:Uncharacterized protein n=1 Tax=Brevibacillus agri TaxID=51101 RepID=A0A3M8AVG1_9BACL|nr:hypothetical protein [Brevibacillus agri]MBY0051106.1 hypothetical protein [Brevibacillus agri]MDN4092902.1 hypothetical protein [Brevibacillus agri]QAV13351.1 hypothetical protein BA6348_11710 [Brevibacillus agri]RNB55176.1 hypothetical protein EB820_12190 [Brevibacillus agri]GED26133.1 hypothetical protein BAG01nite_22350 [Brevibacillus agri]